MSSTTDQRHHEAGLSAKAPEIGDRNRTRIGSPFTSGSFLPVGGSPTPAPTFVMPSFITIDTVADQVSAADIILSGLPGISGNVSFTSISSQVQVGPPFAVYNIFFTAVLGVELDIALPVDPLSAFTRGTGAAVFQLAQGGFKYVGNPTFSPAASPIPGAG